MLPLPGTPCTAGRHTSTPKNNLMLAYVTPLNENRAHTTGLHWHFCLYHALQEVCKCSALQVTVVDAQRILTNLNSGDLLADRRLAATEEDQRTVPQLLTEQIEFADVLVRQLTCSGNEDTSVCLTSDGVAC